MTKDITTTTTITTVSRQPSKKARREVRAAFDGEMLADICVMKDFSDYAERHDLSDGIDGHKRFYYYKDNGSDILAVAHLDSVQADGSCQIIDTAAGLLAVSGTLDDRLGAYVILELLPRLGVECDILLTTDEEICQSTAEDFWPDKKYHWMFSFDRGGTDVVMYEYETPDLCDLVEEAGARVGQGSFSDICQLEHLDCAGFNWGVGYQDYHSTRAHAWLDDTFRMVARFVKFYNANATDALHHEPYWRRKKHDDLEEWIEADCGHDVDMNDDRTFIESGLTLVCYPCGILYDLEWTDGEIKQL